jgi:hypothetical protein
VGPAGAAAVGPAGAAAVGPVVAEVRAVADRGAVPVTQAARVPAAGWVEQAVAWAAQPAEWGVRAAGWAAVMVAVEATAVEVTDNTGSSSVVQTANRARPGRDRPGCPTPRSEAPINGARRGGTGAVAVAVQRQRGNKKISAGQKRSVLTSASNLQQRGAKQRIARPPQQLATCRSFGLREGCIERRTAAVQSFGTPGPKLFFFPHSAFLHPS